MRAPILRKVHLDTTGRLEDLVAALYNAFVEDILPGENVYIYAPERRSRNVGIVRDKAVFPATKERGQMTRFFVQLPGNDKSEHLPEIVVDQDHIQRKPKTFTKAAITQFLRYTVDREKYEGAPWMVKQPYADRYGLDTRVPVHLTAEAIAQNRKAEAIARKSRNAIGFSLPSGFVFRNNEIVPRPGHQPSQKEIQSIQDRFPIGPNGQQMPLPRPLANGRPHSGHFGELAFTPPAPPPPKYPIEDLRLEPRRTATQRPPLKDFTKLCPFPDESVLEGKERLKMSSVGLLLEVWNTFQVFGPSFFFVDGFTLDDFLGALYIASDKIQCQLFVELHCAVLQRLVDEDGDVLARALTSVLTAEEKKAEDDDLDENATAENADEVKEDTEMSDASDSQPANHRAAEMAQAHDWVQLVKEGDLLHGGWQVAMVGLLEQLSRGAKYLRPACESVLEQLAPLDWDATRQTAQTRYNQLGINARIQALELATRLVVDTSAFKAKMNEIMSGATGTRKEKTSTQTQRKALLKQLDDLNQQRKLKRPDNIPEADEAAATQGDNDDDEPMKVDDADERYSDERSGTGEDSEDEDASIALNRRKSDRMANLKRKREEEEELDRVEKMQTNRKEADEYLSVLRAIRKVKDDIGRCEEQIAALDDDLRENFCHRTKLLGRDRFINRYHWFERNGMPLEGDKDSSTVYGYANGRLWLQGGDALDRQGIVDLDPEDDKAHRSEFKMTIKERRDLDEGVTQLNGADAWGYYDEPEEITRLISWLKEKGEREKKLKKELSAWHEPIVKSMENLKQHLAEMNKKFEEHEERPQRGVALRKKAAAESSQVRFPCTIWTNSAAEREFGMLLSTGRVAYPSEEEPVVEEEKPVEKAANKKSRKNAVAEVQEAAPPEKRTTRRGTRYAR